MATHDGVISDIRELIAREPQQTAGLSPLVDVLRRLCDAAVRDLPAMGCGINLMVEGGALGVAADVDAASEALEELQFTVGEGPCIDAFAARRPVLEADLAAGGERRWPGYVPAALAHGVRGVFAFPLQMGAACFGVMDVYVDRPGGLTTTALGRAFGFADVAMEVVLDGQALAQQGRPAEGLDEAVDNRSNLYQAQGMVMVQLGVDLMDAMVCLRAHAYCHERRLGEVVHDVVSGRLRLDDVDAA
jgi:hypothetical protein